MQEGLLAPIHFVLTSPIYHLLQLGSNSQMISDSYETLQNYIKMFKTIRKSMLIAESKLFTKRRIRNSKSKDTYEAQIGDLVFIDYEKKPNSFDFGIIVGMEGSDSLVQFRNSKREHIPTCLLYALSLAKHSMGIGDGGGTGEIH